MAHRKTGTCRRQLAPTQRLLWLSACLTAGVASPCLAQEASPSTVEEIIVTAEHRAANIQDVPASLVALSGRDLESSAVLNTADLATKVPNLDWVAVGSARANRVGMRGQVSDANNPGLEQSVNFYVDGVVQGRASTIDDALIDVERVEVLRGPQGTLYGRNATGGVVNVISREPDPTAYGFDMNATAGSFSLWSGDATVNIPLGGHSALRASAFAADRDGYSRDISVGERQNDLNRWGARVALLLGLGESSDLTLRASFVSDDNSGTVFDVRRVGLDPVLLGGVDNSDGYDFVTATSFPGRETRDAWRTSAEFRSEMGGYRFVSITGYQGYQGYNFADTDGASLDILGSGVEDDQRQFSQEFRIESPQSDRLDWQAGLYYFNQNIENVTSVRFGQDLALLFPLPPGFLPYQFAFTGDTDTRAWAAFVHGRLSLTPEFSVTGGLRYTDEEKETHFVQPAVALAGQPAFDLNPQISAQEWTPEVSLNFEPDDDVLLYLRYARGFKGGGFNISGVNNPGITFEPETVDSFEAGVKLTLLDDRMRLNVAAFRAEYSNLQVNQLILVSALPTFQASNAAAATSDGVEIDWEFLPFSDLRLAMNYGFNDAMFDSFPGCTSGGLDCTGNELPKAPRHSFNAAAIWTIAMPGEMSTMLRAEYARRSSYFDEADNDPDRVIEGVNLWNASATLSIGDRWSLMAWGNNLTDERYATITVPQSIFGGLLVYTGPPRSYGLTLRAHF